MDLIYGEEKNDSQNMEAFGILMLCDVRNGNWTSEWRLRSHSLQLITNNKRFNVRGNIIKRNRSFSTQIMVLLKSSLLEVHPRGDAMSI